MAEVERLDLEDATSVLDEEDEATLAAIARGIKAAEEGRIVPIEGSASTGSGVVYQILFTEDALGGQPATHSIGFSSM
jgi:hypothetical protein